MVTFVSLQLGYQFPAKLCHILLLNLYHIQVQFNKFHIYFLLKRISLHNFLYANAISDHLCFLGKTLFIWLYINRESEMKNTRLKYSTISITRQVIQITTENSDKFDHNYDRLCRTRIQTNLTTRQLILVPNSDKFDHKTEKSDHKIGQILSQNRTNSDF